jgi:ABC-type nitrate/sulfonate/bicarbonate transport system ATPase subunit
MAHIFDLSPRTQFRWIYLPSIEPEIKASLNLIAGLSWKSVVAAEVLSVPKFSMGYNLLNAKVYFETAELFAWILAIVGLAYAFEQLIHFLLGKIQWKEYHGSKLMKKDHGLEIDSKDSISCICVEGMDKCFGKKQVFSGYEITIEPGQVTAVMGPSGKGKTTLLRIISGLEDADRGKIDLGCERVSYLFQEDRLLPWLNLYDNLAIVLKGKVEFAAAGPMIREALERMELSDDIDKLPQQLSGGMNRRVSMARSFVYPAGLLLLDEPFKGLDKALKDRIIEGSWKYYTKDKTVLMVTHSPSDAERLAQRIIEI